MGADDKIRCDACPVLCYLRPGSTGACDRYANDEGRLVHTDPHLLLRRAAEDGASVVPFGGGEWTGNPILAADTFVTAIGAGTTYPDDKPAPFIVAARVDGLDTVTVVTEGIFPTAA